MLWSYLAIINDFQKQQLIAVCVSHVAISTLTCVKIAELVTHELTLIYCVIFPWNL